MTMLGCVNNLRKPLMNDNIHWINGFEEYFTYIQHPQLDSFQDIKKAIVHGNIYKIRDLVKREIHRGYNELTDEFLQLIFSKHIEYDHTTHRKVLRYISHCIDDQFLRQVSAWSISSSKSANLNDHFSRGQIMSKLWLMNIIDEHIEIDSIQNIVLYGGWYATIAYFLFERFTNIEKLYSLDLDPDARWISDKFNYPQCYDQSWRFKAFEADVCNLQWKKRAKNTWYIEQLVAENDVVCDIRPDLIINTSCEHMDDTWFEQIPSGKLVCLQTNNYFENTQHINCVNNTAEAEEKYQFSQLIYSGSLDTPEYERYMLLGIK